MLAPPHVPCDPREDLAPRCAEDYFRALCPVLGTPATPFGHARCVQGTPDRMVANAGKILDASAPNEHDRVFLQVVTFAADIGIDLVAVRQAHATDLPQGGVRFARRSRVDAGADAALLRRCLQRRHDALRLAPLARFANQLADSRHVLFRYSFPQGASAHSDAEPQGARYSMHARRWHQAQRCRDMRRTTM